MLFTYSAHAKEQVVRVLIDEKIKIFQMFSLYPIRIDTSSGEVIDLNYGKSDVQISATENKWHITVKAHGQITEKKIESDQLKVSAKKINWEKNLIDFPIIISKTKKNLRIVGLMTMNRYLQGVLPHEMPAGWPLEALKVQAVASRTYALWKIKNSSYDNFDLKPSVADQVFKMEKYDELQGVHPQVEKALAATESMFLGMGSTQKVFKAYFHADCGGDTESANAVWGKSHTQTSGVRDVACSQRKSDWRSMWSVKALRDKLMRSFVLPESLDLTNIVVRHQSKSQRVESVDILFSNGFFKRMSGEDLRRTLGYDKIKSTLFSVQLNGAQVVFTGRGHGHGVGMCQWGASSMARSGRDFREILKHYYPAARLYSPENIDQGVERTSVSSLFQ